MDELGGREVHARDAYAAVLDRVGFISYEELHQTNACGGCRVIDNPKDPRPRAPETLATAGLYVYGHAAVGRSAWLRMASRRLLAVSRRRSWLEAAAGAERIGRGSAPSRAG